MYEGVLQWASPELKRNKSFVMSAMRSNGLAIQYPQPQCARTSRARMHIAGHAAYDTMPRRAAHTAHSPQPYHAEQTQRTCECTGAYAWPDMRACTAPICRYVSSELQADSDVALEALRQQPTARVLAFVAVRNIKQRIKTGLSEHILGKCIGLNALD